MLKLDWRNGFAVGLTVGMCATLIVLSFLSVRGPREQAAQDISYSETRDSAEQGQSSNSPDSTWWHWDGWLVSSGDTAAQWIMTIFTIVAAGLLYGTLRTANQTNNAAIIAARAAAEANRIMSRNAIIDQRAWVSLNVNKIGPVAKREDGGTTVWIDITVRNTGKTPAIKMHFHTEARTLYGKGVDIGPIWVTNAIQNREKGISFDGGALAPNEERRHVFGYAIQLKDFASIEEVNKHAYELVVGVAYKPVVGDKECFTFKVISAIAQAGTLEMNTWNMLTLIR